MEKFPLLFALNEGLKTGTITQAQVLEVLHDADPNVMDHDGTIEAARSNYADDDIEIDDKPLLSVSEEGVWVSAWVYVPLNQDELPDDHEG